VPIFDDVFERPSPPPGGGRVVRGAERKALESYSPSREWLVTPTSDDTFTVFFTVLPVGADSGGAYSHLGGQEVLYVLSGEVELTVEGEVWLLAAGDAITLRATEEHGWRNPSDDPAEVLWIVERPGDGPRD
jgi:quercetin dioxygenase-like cupin family protein